MDAVLPVEDVEFDPSVWSTGDVSQMTAEQYLSWVRCQAATLPEYKRAAVSVVPDRQSQYMPQVDEILRCPSTHLPDEEWQIDILHSFSELRLSLLKLSSSEPSRERKEVVPQMKDRYGWYKFCLGAASSSSNDNITSSSSGNNASSVIISNDVAEAAATLKRKRMLAEQLGITIDSSSSATEEQPDDMDQEAEDSDSGEADVYPDENIDLAHTQSGIPEWTGSMGVTPTTSVLLQFDQVLTQKVFSYLVDWLEESQLTSSCSRWLYGLLARLEKPVCQNTVAIIRQLYRKCCSLRHTLCLDCETFDTDLASLNILISITGSYFGQGEEYVNFNHIHNGVLRDSNNEMDEDEEDEEDGEGDWEAEEEVAEDKVEEQPDKRMKFSAPIQVELEDGECE